MRPLFATMLALLSLSSDSQIAPLFTFTKAETKEALGFVSAQKPVTPNSKFIFATGDMKGFIKINGKIITLKYGYAEEDSAKTVSTDYYNDEYYVLRTSRVLKMGKDLSDPDNVREPSLKIKDKRTEKLLFSGKIYPLEDPKEPEKFSLLDADVIDQVLGDLVGGLKRIPQHTNKNNSLESPLKIIKGSRSESSIITGGEGSFLIFTSYNFNSTPAISVKLLKEFLELKKEIAPISEKEKVKTEGKETITSFIYWRPLYFARLNLKVEKLSATATTNLISIEYYPKDKSNGSQLLMTRMLDSVLSNAGTISRVMKNKVEEKVDSQYFSIHPRYYAVNSSVIIKPSPWVFVNKSKYIYTVHLTENSDFTIPKFLSEIKKYMADNYKSTGLFKAGKSFQLPNELVFTKFDKNNPAIEIKVSYFEDGKEVLFRFMISNTISKEEGAKIAAIPIASQTPVAAKETEKKPPLLRLFRDKNGLYGFQDINNGFAVVIPAEYKFVGKVSEGLIAVTKDGDKWGYIDESNKLVIPYKYVSAKEYVNGKALVEEGDLFQSTKFYIDKSGRRL
jgi:hypothetical protein